MVIRLRKNDAPLPERESRRGRTIKSVLGDRLRGIGCLTPNCAMQNLKTDESGTENATFTVARWNATLNVVGPASYTAESDVSPDTDQGCQTPERLARARSLFMAIHICRTNAGIFMVCV